jgi:hypothetical protein
MKRSEFEVVRGFVTDNNPMTGGKAYRFDVILIS